MDKQPGLFGDTTGREELEDEWGGMPEFVQNKIEPYAKIIVRINSEEDLSNFSKLVGQRLTRKTKSIWYPKLSKNSYSEFFYVNET